MDLEDDEDDLADISVREKRRRTTRKRMTTTQRRRTEGRSHDGRDEQGKVMGEGDNDDGYEDDNHDEDELEEKFLCRVPIRTIATVLRPRKGVRSLRIKSLGTAGFNATTSSTTRTDHIDGHGDIRPGRRGRAPVHTNDNDNDNDNNNNNNNNNNNDDYEEQQEEDQDQTTPIMQLSFEFQVTANGIMRIIHKVGVTDAKGVVAISSKEGCSEIVALPKLLLNMLEPLKQTNEVALTVSDEEKIVTATSFHHSDAVGGGGGADGLGGGENMVLAALAAGVMKTETNIDCDEFDEFHYFADGLAGDKEDGGDEMIVPDDVGQQVTLVFGIKESKALLQFCSQSNIDEELRAIVSFHWGGRPITIETEGDAFHSQLILATVDHKLLKGGNFGTKRQQQQQPRRNR